MITLDSFTADDILSHVEQNGYFEYKGLKIKTASERLFCFKKNTSCVCCGIKGTIFLLQKHNVSDFTPHFNLYAEKNGSLILMTKDHIIPVSSGGPTRQSNLQTLCADCNQLKADIPMTLDQLKIIRETYLSLLNIMSVKKARSRIFSMAKEIGL